MYITVLEEMFLYISEIWKTTIRKLWLYPQFSSFCCLFGFTFPSGKFVFKSKGVVFFRGIFWLWNEYTIRQFWVLTCLSSFHGSFGFVRISFLVIFIATRENTIGFPFIKSTNIYVCLPMNRFRKHRFVFCRMLKYLWRERSQFNFF